ncbi:MAG: DUF4007 family protein [Methanolobus sp.]|uniref:DUF4007 family protein n=1 Tax=Methanolobus sp. TaxID=1874737 RepID=UPI002731687D|nr:DUF4007 family protein [Methanolobus sp.]MDP2218323.1 DUF4007 family protein [Methanolobus sp.]
MESIIKDKSNQNINPVFARHETFHPRFGWLKKGFDKAIETPDVFLSKAAPSILGVGKNMVKAIKYWCITFKVLEEIKEQGQGRHIAPTAFGQNLLGNGGWDPYLEDPASLWLLHWYLLKPPCHATAWYYVFNVFNKNTFGAEEVRDSLIEFKNSSFLNNRIFESSVMKDVACILRMYTEQHGNKVTEEDSIDSPFTELGLIHNYGDSKRYIFNTGSKHNLPPGVIVATCLDYVDIIQEAAKTISISRLAYEAGSPGLCFRLSESALADAIESIARHSDEIFLSDTAGLIQMSFEGEPKVLSRKLLEDYYNRGKN